jgi:hypothetical protein
MLTLVWRTCGDPDALEPRLQAIDASGDAQDVDMDIADEKVESVLPPHLGGAAMASTGLRLVHIAADLKPGTQIIFSFIAPEDASKGKRTKVRLKVVADAPRPKTLGVLDAKTETGKIEAGSGDPSECIRTLLARYADVSLRMSAEAKPYAELLRYELRIDGNRYWRFSDSAVSPTSERLGASSVGLAKDRVVVSCELSPYLPPVLPGLRYPPALEPGKHQVRMIGSLPDGSELSTNEITVDLSCPENSPFGRWSHTDYVQPESSLIRDIQTGSRVPGAAESLPPAAHSGGCSLRAPNGSATPRSLALLVTIVAFARARRRRALCKCGCPQLTASVPGAARAPCRTVVRTTAA